MAVSNMLFLSLIALASNALVLAYDPSPLQDICVAEKTNVFMNGMACKDPALATNDDFAFEGLHNAGDTKNKLGSKVTLVDVHALPGLNTLGMSMARLDIAPGGLNPPHTHPRATEVLTVIDGQLYVGFIDTANRLFARVLNKGDVFVFPKGLVHFEFNTGQIPVVAIAGLNSQNPGLIRVADAVFGANPVVPDDVLMKAFQIDKEAVQKIKAQVTAKN